MIVVVICSWPAASPVIYINGENLFVSVYFGAIFAFRSAATSQESTNTQRATKKGRTRERAREKDQSAHGFVSVYNSIRRAAKPDKTFLRLLRSILYVCLSATHRFARHWPLLVVHYSSVSSTFFACLGLAPKNQAVVERLTNRVKISKVEGSRQLFTKENDFFTIVLIDVRFGSRWTSSVSFKVYEGAIREPDVCVPPLYDPFHGMVYTNSVYAYAPLHLFVHFQLHSR